jgi:hypothetical protein
MSEHGFAEVVTTDFVGSAGWDDVASALLCDDAHTMGDEAPVSFDPCPAAIPTDTGVFPRRGRPPAVLGSHALRSELRSEADSIEPAGLPVALMPRQPRPKSGNQHVHDQLDAFPDRSKFGMLVNMASRAGSLVQRSLMVAASKWFSMTGSFEVQEADISQDGVCAAVEALLSPTAQRHTMTIQAETSTSNTAASSFKRFVPSIAAATAKSCTALWGGLMGQTILKVRQGSMKAHLFIKKRVYDETPLKLRVAAEGTKENSIGKIMQTQFSIGMLVEEVSSGRLQFLEGIVPTSLQCLQQTKGADLARSQQLIEDSVPDLENASDLFDLQLQLVTTDRYGANTTGEASMQAAHPRYVKLHTPCDVHKASSCQTAQLNLASDHITGIINCGLSMREAGATALFRQHLFDIISERLIICREEPPGGRIKQYRLDVYDVFLSTNLTRADDKPFYRQLRSKQRAVLSFFLNGDLEKHDVVDFYTTTQITRGEVLCLMKQHLVPALLPHGISIFPRSRWLGGECAVDSCGLIACHHNLFEPAMKRMLHEPEAEQQPEQPVNTRRGWVGVSSEPRQEPCQEHEQPLQFDPGSVDLDPSDLPAAQPVLPEVLPSGDESKDTNWAEVNKTIRSSALKWVNSSPVDELVIIRLAMSVTTTLICKFLYLAGTKWEREQRHKASTGHQQRSYRMLEAFLGNDVREAFATITRLFHTVPAALRLEGMTESLKVFLFRLLSRVAGSIDMLLRHVRSGFPYKLFGVLRGCAADILQSSACLFDEIAHWFVTKFDTVEKMYSQLAQAMMHGIATMAQVDISGIEARHAAARRLLLTKSLHTWQASLEQLAADFFCRGFVIRRNECMSQFRGEPVDSKRKAAAKARQKKPKQTKPKSQDNSKRKQTSRTGGGGAQRAFFHERLQEEMTPSVCGSKRSRKEVFTQLNAEFRALTPAQKAHYQDIGNSAAFSHLGGHRSFGVTRKVMSAKRKRSLLELPPAEPSDAIVHALAIAHRNCQVIAMQEKVAEVEVTKALATFQLDAAAASAVDFVVDGHSEDATDFLATGGPVPSCQWLPPGDVLAKALLS